MEYKEVLKSYFKDNSLVESQIRSYNYFIENGLKNIVMSFDRTKIPEYLIDVYDEVNLTIEDVWLGEPVHVEVDGSITKLTPQTARFRGLTYAAPLYLKVGTLIGTQKDEFEVQIARMPIMLKSSRCILKDKSVDELIELGEDPYEPGGYFVINGTEKVVVLMEDLALNKFFVENIEDIEPSGRMFSERGVYKSLQEIKRLKDGSYTYTFGNFKNIPLFLLLKTLGLTKDKDIVELTGVTDSEVIFQMSEYSGLTDLEEAIEVLAKRFSLVGSQKEKSDRVSFYLDNFILPHVGVTEDKRIEKAKLICKLFKRYFGIINKVGDVDDKDSYSNKRVKLVGQLFEHLFVNNFNDLIIDILTNFQRMIKRGRFSSMKIIIREQLLTQKINSALAIGTWSDGRKGVSQYLKRENYFDMLSHLTRVVSPLSTSQENFAARELHSTHFGRLCPVETPEGDSIGLRKNLALMATVTYKSNPITEELIEKLSGYGLNDSGNGGDVFVNEIFVGNVAKPADFVKTIRNARRSGEMDESFNVYHDKKQNFVYLEGNPGRTRRPLIVVEKGKSKLTKEITNKLKVGDMRYDDLLNSGVVEYLDALEENDAFVAITEPELTLEHTHLEISPILMFGLNTGTVPFCDYDEPGRLMRGQKTIKQAVGTYALNYLQRRETDRNLLVNPQIPLAQTFIYDLLGLETHPAGQNCTIAIMSYEGYNMEDGLILNQSSVERGLQRSVYYKLHKTAEIKYPGGLQDKVDIPHNEVKGYRMEEDYRYLEDDGVTYVGQYVTTGDVIVGKVSPPRFIEEIEGFGQMINLNVDSSLSLKEDEKGVVSSVTIVENSDGDKEINVLLRDYRSPIVGDKFASRHGQKGVIGALMRQADMPFSENGIVPDVIFSPHSIPGRKTVSHVMEVLAGKVAALRGEFVDASAFDGETEDDLRKQLESYGFNATGSEVMFDPKTGKMMKSEIYIGSLYYLRLKHQVENKIQARGTGPVQLLTRQPAEGRIRGGGLKLGEMEKDALISHGAALLLKERFSSDQTTALVCESCGYLADPYLFRYKSKCPICSSSKFDEVELAYAFKLLVNELRSMGINPGFATKDRFFE